MIVPVFGYESLYEINEEGLIYSLKYKLFLKTQLNKKTKYVQVTLCKNGKHKTERLHCLVLKSFIKAPSKKHEVNHKDGNRLNNILANLEWVTRSENIKHSYDVVKRQKICTKNQPFNKPANKILPKGISAHQGRFRVRITNNTKKSGFDSLGVYKSLEEAIEIYRNAHIEKYGVDPYLDISKK